MALLLRIFSSLFASDIAMVNIYKDGMLQWYLLDLDIKTTYTACATFCSDIKTSLGNNL